MFFTTKHNSKYLDTEKMVLKICDNDVKSTSCVRNMGVFFDSNMVMEKHVNILCRSAYSHLRNIGHSRRYLTNDATKSLVNSLVMSRLDYCNGLLFGLPTTMISKLQHVQNTAPTS